MQMDLKLLTIDTIKNIVRTNSLSEEQLKELVRKEEEGRKRSGLLAFLAARVLEAREDRQIKEARAMGNRVSMVWVV